MGRIRELPGPADLGKFITATRAVIRRSLARIASQSGDEFTLAYATNLSHRLPLLYSVLLFDLIALMFEFSSAAPAALVFWIPLVPMALICWRAVYWTPSLVRRRPVTQLQQDIRRLPVIGSLAAIIPLTWALALYPYGSEAQQSLIHYITAVSCFTAVLSLGQSPRTAIAMSIVTVIPSSIFFHAHDHPNSSTIIAIQTVVSALLVMITKSYHSDFVGLENSRQELVLSKQQSEALAETNRQIAIKDPLTGVNNRRRIVELVEQALAAPVHARPWLALVDLDGFKHINDTYGHAAGDAVLCALSNRIASVAEIEAFGRMGGDEFALLILGKLHASEVLETVNGMCADLQRPIEHEGHRLVITASVGIHLCQGTNVSECFERADAALYKAKSNHLVNGGVEIFSAADECDLQERRLLLKSFDTANFESQLALVYQPIVECDTRKPVAYEALVRWSPDGKSLLSPAEFISLAETTGRIWELTEHVLERALSESRAWQWGCKLAVNLSAHDTLRDGIAPRIASIVSAAGAPPEAIILEITETALLTDYNRAAANLMELRELGFRIALDDFGTGQSSLSHVHNLPIDHLKIDQAFARDLVDCSSARAIVATILALARQLGLECTIEGIETPQQQLIARGLGVRMMQGYLFSQPMLAVDAFSSHSVERTVVGG